MNRRQFVTRGAAVGAIVLSGHSWSQQYRPDFSKFASMPRLSMPPLLDATDTGRFELVAKAGQTNFFGLSPTQTIGYNQAYLGPTIRLSNGAYTARVTNQLNESVTAHWHGLVIPGDVDGGPHQPIATGSVWKPDLDIEQSPCTAWYHTHAHQRTAIQVHAGLAGLIQLTDGRDRDRGLPANYGVDDLTLVLQDRRFDQQGRMVYSQNMMDMMLGFMGNTMLINGQVGTVAAVPRGIVRLRLLNGSNARIYTLFMSDNRPMHLAATDGGYLPETLALTKVRLAPGERVELLVDFSSSESVALMSEPNVNSGPGAMMGRFRGSVQSASFIVQPFIVDDTMKSAIDRLPTKLGGESPNLDESTVALSRRLVLNVGMGPGMMGRMMRRGQGGMSINGQSFETNRIDFKIKKGSVERWHLETSMLAHPFHIHGLQFQIISENGGTPRIENRGWKDTILIANEAEILVRFNRLANEQAPYMAHCHILEHEDAGMMLQFTVT